MYNQNRARDVCRKCRFFSQGPSLALQELDAALMLRCRLTDVLHSDVLRVYSLYYLVFSVCLILQNSMYVRHCQ